MALRSEISVSIMPCALVDNVDWMISSPPLVKQLCKESELQLRSHISEVTNKWCHRKRHTVQWNTKKLTFIENTHSANEDEGKTGGNKKQVSVHICSNTAHKSACIFMPVFLEPNICILTCKITVWIHAHFIMRELCADSQAPTGWGLWWKKYLRRSNSTSSAYYLQHAQTHKHTHTHTLSHRPYQWQASLCWSDHGYAA